MAKDYVPGTDAEFDIFVKHFVPTVAANPAKYGLSPAEATALQAALTTWSTDYAAQLNADLARRTATQKKEDSRDAVEKLVRPAVRKINGTTTVTNADRTGLGLPARDDTRTAIPVPTSRPIGRLESNIGLRHIVQWADDQTPHARRKPEGVHGCELCLKIGDPAPVDDSTATHRVVDTATPYVYDFDPADAGKTAYWMLRWVNPKGEAGPWGVVVSGKINP